MGWWQLKILFRTEQTNYIQNFCFQGSDIIMLWSSFFDGGIADEKGVF